MSIGLIAVVHNEAERIGDFLRQAFAICDEAIVVDQDSSDGTAELARGWQATVHTDRHWGFPEPSLAYAEAFITTDWVLRLDADEYIAEEHWDWVRDVPNQTGDWAELARVSTVDGDLIEDNVWHIRMWKKGTVTHGGNRLHAPSMPPGYPQLRGGIRSPKGVIQHHKTQAEQDLDADNYKRLMEAGIKVGWNS
jgi:glycosyltransferase involved in cell wall biosynthesis